MSGGASLAVVILAAGQGTRMKSELPKVLHEVAGRPMLEHVLRAARPLGAERTMIVIGHGAERVRDRFADSGVEFALQERQLGTGHALSTALDAMPGFDGAVMVLTGDSPLLTPDTLAALWRGHQEREAGATLLTYRVDDPTGLGRIVRDGNGRMTRIVEEKDASDEERAITEINPGFFVFDRRVREFVGRLGNDNAQGEFYLTDLPAIYLAEGLDVHTVEGADETGLLVGVNDRHQLARAERFLRDRIRRRWLSAGVTMLAPETTFVDDGVDLGRDVVLEPGVVLRGRTRVGEGARVGAYSVLEDAVVGAGESIAPHSRICSGC